MHQKAGGRLPVLSLLPHGASRCHSTTQNDPRGTGAISRPRLRPSKEVRAPAYAANLWRHGRSVHPGHARRVPAHASLNRENEYNLKREGRPKDAEEKEECCPKGRYSVRTARSTTVLAYILQPARLRTRLTIDLSLLTANGCFLDLNSRSSFYSFLALLSNPEDQRCYCL